MNNIPWSDEENDALRQIAEHGGTTKDALAILSGRTKDAIMNHATKLGLSLAGGVNEINQEAFRRFLRERGK